MGFLSKIKEAILGESVEHDNLNEDMDLNEAEALDEDFDALDEEMGYVDEGLASDAWEKKYGKMHDDGSLKRSRDEKKELEFAASRPSHVNHDSAKKVLDSEYYNKHDSFIKSVNDKLDSK